MTGLAEPHERAPTLGTCEHITTILVSSPSPPASVLGNSVRRVWRLANGGQGGSPSSRSRLSQFSNSLRYYFPQAPYLGLGLGLHAYATRSREGHVLGTHRWTYLIFYLILS